MIGDLILAAISFVGLMGYSTIGVAVTQALRPRMVRREFVAPNAQKTCYDCDSGSRRGSSCYHYEHIWHNSFWPGVFWLPCAVVYGSYQAMKRTTFFLAKGPTCWGTALAALPERRHNALKAAEKARDEALATVNELTHTLPSEWVAEGERRAQEEILAEGLTIPA